METYTKIEVAVRALLQAKELYLQADYVSATILAGAGQRIVKDICRRRGIESTFKKISNQSSFTVTEIQNLVVDSYNKLKHADRDPDGLVNVSEEEPRAGNDFLLIDCKNYYVSSNSAYLLNPKSKKKISEILEAQITESYPLPIDLLWMREIEQNRILCKFTFPYMIGLENLADSSIQSNNKFSSPNLLEDQLNLFYIDADLEKLIEKYTASAELIATNKEQFLASQILFRRLLY